MNSVNDRGILFSDNLRDTDHAHLESATSSRECSSAIEDIAMCNAPSVAEAQHSLDKKLQVELREMEAMGLPTNFCNSPLGLNEVSEDLIV